MPDDAGQPARRERSVVLARRARRGQDRRAELLHRQVPDPALPAADLPGRRHAVRRPLGAPGRDQRDRDRLRPQPERLLRGRAGLDAVHARVVGGLRRRRQPGRADGPVQPGRRDLRRRALPEGRRRRHGHPRRRLRLQPRRLVRRLRAPARPGHRRPAVEPRRLAHRPDRGSLPGRRQGHLRRRGLTKRSLRAKRRGNPAVAVESSSNRRGHLDLRRRRLAGRRGERLARRQDRRLEAARPLRPGPGRLRQHLHVRAPGQDLDALRRAEAAEDRPGRGPPPARAAGAGREADRAGVGHRSARPRRRRRKELAERPIKEVRAGRRPRRARRRARRRSRSACSRTRRARTRRSPAAPSRSSCAPAGSTARSRRPARSASRATRS